MIREVKLGDILEYEQPNMYIVKNTNYDKKFSTPVLTAGQSFILGYTNEKENIFKAKENPVIIFDDFTTASKYVDFDFKVKSSAMKILKAREGINIKYVYYAMQNIKFDNQLHKRYWISEYSKIKLLLPDIKMQEKIVKELDLINKLLDYKKKQIELFDDFIKSQFVEMFGNVELNDKYFYEQEISDIAEITSSKRIYANEYQKNGVPFYRSKEIIELGHKKKPSIELYISIKKYKEIKEKYGIPKIGDILITAVGTIGETWIVDTEGPFYYKDGNVLQIRLKKENSQLYFKHVLDILINIFKRKNVSGSSYLALTIEKFKKMKMIIPPIDLQNQFSEIVKQIDKQKFEIEKSLKETQELYESLMEKYFG